MSELIKRVAFALVTAPIFVAILWLGGWYLTILILIIGWGIQYEIGMMTAKTGMPVNWFVALAGGSLIMLGLHIPFISLWLLFLLILLIIMETIDTVNGGPQRIMSTLLCSIYAPLGLYCFLALRAMGGTNGGGFSLCLALVLMIWGSDTFAYFGGKQFGKHPLAPSISPNKTWEGFWMGFLGAGAGLLIVILSMAKYYPVHGWNNLALVLIVGIIGPIGDLAESRLKRWTGVKDSGTVFPGHGGFFDRFDTIILSSISLFLYLKIVNLAVLYG